MSDSQSPWGGNDNKNPWENEIPPKEVQFKESQENLRRVLRSMKKPPIKSKANAWGLAALVVCLWVLTGFYQVQPEEQGVVLRFGKYAYTTAT